MQNAEAHDAVHPPARGREGGRRKNASASSPVLPAKKKESNMCTYTHAHTRIKKRSHFGTHESALTSRMLFSRPRAKVVSRGHIHGSLFLCRSLAWARGEVAHRYCNPEETVARKPTRKGSNEAHLLCERPRGWSVVVCVWPWVVGLASFQPWDYKYFGVVMWSNSSGRTSVTTFLSALHMRNLRLRRV